MHGLLTYLISLQKKFVYVHACSCGLHVHANDLFIDHPTAAPALLQTSTIIMS